MSHFTRMKTRMVSKEFLLQALSDLGYQWEEGDVKVRGWAGRQEKAEIRLEVPHSKHDIGFVPTDAGYEIVADWYGIKGITRQEFTQQVYQRYAYYTARATLEGQGFNLVSEESQEDGRVHLVLRRTV